MQLNLFNTKLPIEQRLIISLFDYTTAWPKPYIEAGYPVICWDLKCEGDILNYFGTFQFRIKEAIEAGYIPYGLLAAPPCTDFSSSGSQWWPKKDTTKEGYEPFACETELSIALVEIVFVILDLYPTLQFWVIENPRGRIVNLCSKLKPYKRLRFHPCDYGDPYTKETFLYGLFNSNLPRTPVNPVMYEKGGKRGSWMWAKLGGKSERTKTLRSVTPAGFAKAFFEANK